MPLSWHQMKMKIYTQEPISPFRKGGRGDFKRTGKNRISNHFLLSKGRELKKIELMRLPRHFVPRNDE
jgi:hypothetical protein